MMACVVDGARIQFDGKEPRLIFHGDCDEMRPICMAMCCRMAWDIPISAEEYASRQYIADVMCALTDKACRETSEPCNHRRYRLARGEDGGCYHLKENRCSIYGERPKTCRDFQCQGGWRIATSVYPSDEGDGIKQPALPFHETFIGALNDDLVFVLHPLIRLHSIFIRRAKKDIIFVKEMVGACGKFTTRDAFDHPLLDDDGIMALVDQFNRKEPLGTTYQSFSAQYPDLLTHQEFFEVVWLLNKHTIILDSRNFPGMLAGMGGIG